MVEPSVKEPPGRGYPRLLMLLELLAETEEPLTVSTMAQTLDIPKSTAWLLIQHLLTRDYLTSVEDHSYTAGPALYRLGAALISRQPIRMVARPHLEALRKQVEANIYLATRVGDEVVYLDRLEQPQMVNITAPLTQPRQLHCTAAGKVILALSADGLWERFSQRHTPLPAPTSKTITKMATLSKEIDAVRSRGYAISDGEQYEGVLSIGAPIIDAAGNLMATVVVSGYAPLMREDLDDKIDAVTTAAARISADL